ncbi:WD repeat-containing protein isoform 1 [Schistosoma japonicum]|uniref:WD repeat-containing protein isoform 1 n=3 Tax=Schistosoma japonicum TaxID=6182 RepID=A0A4Z2DQX6_SCHJA|nr:WD repeat-containing protein isoform 1 [Schistosoma japonicum]
MKVTHTYQRYNPKVSYGIITSDLIKVSYISDNGSKLGDLCLCGAGEKAIIWKPRTSQMVCSFARDTGSSPISCLKVSETSNLDPRVAIGYVDGLVNLVNIKTGDIEAHFRAGRSRVTSMDLQNDLLISAADSEINVFDIVSGSGTRMKGHHGIITKIKILPVRKILISSAQDSFIKFWDLKTQHCFATLTGHPGPVWDFSLAHHDEILVSGTNDQNLRVWRINYVDENDSPLAHVSKTTSGATETISSLSEPHSQIVVQFVGCVKRSGVRRVNCLAFDPTGTYLLCQSFDRNVEIFRLLNEEEKAKRLRKKIKKAKEKGLDPSSVTLNAEDELRPFMRVTLSAKPSSCDILAPRLINEHNSQKHLIRFICALRNNVLEELQLAVPLSTFKLQTLQPTSAFTKKCPSVHLLNSISIFGHRSPVIACSFTSDNLGVFTLSRSEAKLWSRRSTACLTTLEWRRKSDDNYNNVGESSVTKPLPNKASSMVLAPGDRHVVIGYETGQLILFDLTSKLIVQVIDEAHSGAVRSIAVTGDKKTVISGGSDKQVRFYDFHLKTGDNGKPHLCLAESSPAKTVSDQISCLAVTPNNRLLVIALMNFHVDVFFTDSFKRIHSLYGHSAPVTSLDISSDSRLIITGSTDKTVRLWELQFGNCQRRFTSHLEPITCVRFIPHTSLAVSADQGGQIKQWDIKKFREITTLKGHNGGVTCLATTITNTAFLTRKKAPKLENPRKSHTQKNQDEDSDDDMDELRGGLILSTGQDFSIRIWEEADELLILEEEEQIVREQEEEDELVRSEAVIPGAIPSEASEIGPLGRPTSNTRDAADMFMEAMDIYEEEIAKRKNNAKNTTPHPLMIARGTDCPEKFLLKSLMALRAPYSRLGGGGAGLEHTLGALTSDHVRRLLPKLADWLSRGWELELVGRSIRHLVTLHFGLVLSCSELREVIRQSANARTEQLVRVKNLIGMNLAGLECLARQFQENQQIDLFDELITTRDKRIKKHKAKQARLIPLLPD